MTAAGAEDGEGLELELSSDPESVSEVRITVADFARTVGADADGVKLAVSEAVGNSVIHAFRGRDSGTIAVRARSERDRVLVTVADDGIGMTPNPDGGGLGIGLSLIGKLADEVRINSSPEGTAISMSFVARGLSNQVEHPEPANSTGA